jgi:hypothetical protein
VAPAQEGASASVEVAWPSASAPFYVATVSYDYMEVVKYSAFLLKACTAGPGEALTVWSSDEDPLVWGPRGAFAYRGGGGWQVRVEGAVAGELPESAAVPAFRP